MQSHMVAGMARSYMPHSAAIGQNLRMRIMVTGTAGFIGNALAIRLLERGDEVLGVDNLNDYYDVQLKRASRSRLSCTS